MAHIRRAADHRVVPWANGLGITADVFLSPDGVDDWTWRLSIADVTSDVPFSSMPGIDRHIVVAAGRGMALTIDGAPEIAMDGTAPPLSFSGERETTCRLLDGPIKDLNLMVRRSRALGSLRTLRLGGSDALVVAPDDVAVVVLSGSLEVGGATLLPLDAARVFVGDELRCADDCVVAVAAVRAH